MNQTIQTLYVNNPTYPTLLVKQYTILPRIIMLIPIIKGLSLLQSTPLTMASKHKLTCIITFEVMSYEYSLLILIHYTLLS